MREAHPIDDRFRRALAAAEAEPPAELAARITAAAGRKRRALLWRWRLAAVLLLLLAGGVFWLRPWAGTTSRAVAHMAAQHEEAVTAPTKSAPRKVPGKSEEKPQPLVEEPAVTAPAQPASRVEVEAEAVGQPRARRSAPEMAERGGLGAQGGSTNPRAREPRAAEPARSFSPKADAEPAAAEAPQAAPPDRHAPLARLPLLGAWRASLPASPALRTAPTHDYFTPRGTWWIGPMASLQAGRSSWSGGPANLVNALHAGRRWQEDFAGGLLAGRRWPSGWGLWMGLEAERSSQAYRSIERREEIHQELVVTQLVTLNAQVVFVNVDTVSTAYVRESVSEGADSRLRVRIPVEASWTRSLGRWSAGLRGGVHLTYTAARSTASLVADAPDGSIRARALSDAELCARYPASLSAMAGAEIAYSLSDRLALSAVPFAALPFATLGPRAGVWFTHERFGLRFQLLHRF